MQIKEQMNSEARLANVLFGKKPKTTLKNNILETLSNLASEQLFDLTNPPFINKYSDIKLWDNATKHICPPAEFDNMYYHLLLENEERITCLVWVKDTVPEEDHDYYKESFLILEGACNLLVNGTVEHHEAGEYLQIPAMPHEVKVTSDEPLKFIVQRLKVAIAA